MLNLVAQGRLPFADAVRWFESLPKADQPEWLKTIALMCHQSHPHREDIDSGDHSSAVGANVHAMRDDSDGSAA
jgi:hypothetical protein